MTQAEFADLLCVSQSLISRLEAGERDTPREACIVLLRTWLLVPEFQQRLEKAGVAHPFPKDLTHAEESVTGL